jgi:Big-like domain-containing protein/VCBS repeat protein
MSRGLLATLVILAAAAAMDGCRSAPPSVEVTVLLPSSLDAACLKVAAVPASGPPKESDPIVRTGRDAFQVAIFQSKELGDFISVRVQAFQAGCDSPTPIEERFSPVVAFGDGKTVTVSLQALVFDPVPASALAGVTLPAFHVVAVDGSNAPDPTVGDQVMLSVAAGGALLQGTSAVTAVAGSATFSDVRFDRSAAGVALRASAPNFPPVTTPFFDVGPAPPGSVQFSQGPSDVNAGAVMAPVKVTVLDILGAPTSAPVNVTLSLANGPAGAVLAGTLTRTTGAGGVATFNDLSARVAGSGQRLAAAVAGTPGAVSGTFTVRPANPDATKSTLAVSKADVTANGTDTTVVTVTVRDAYDNPVPGLTVSLSATGSPNTFSPAASGNTSGAGVFTASWSSTQSGVKTLTASIVVGTLRTTVTFEPPTCGTLRFTAQNNQTTGSNPLKMIVTDLDADGRPDVVATNLLAGTLTVSMNRGAAGFTTSTYSPDAGSGSRPVALVAGDLDGDPWTDLAVTGQGVNLVWLLHGAGDGGFTRVDLPVSNQPSGIGLADFNGDQATDLVVTLQAGSSAAVYLNQRDGGWALGPGSPVSLGSATGPGMLTVGDFNGDGVPDVAAVSSPTDSVVVLLGDRTGRLTLLRSYAMANGSAPGDVNTADLRDAGKLDLVVTQNNNNNVAVLLGNGDGTFAPAPNSPFATGTQPGTVAVGDLNADRIPDLATANFNNGNASTVSVLLGNGNGTFQPQFTVNAGRGPSGIALGDLSGDLRLDIAVENQLDGTWTPLVNQCF